MATAHLIHGYIGAGKTTLAKSLEQRFQAVLFSLDDWVGRLFGDDPPTELFQEKAAIVLELMEPLWARCLELGLDVVLDFGFWRRAERNRARRVAHALGAETRLYLVESPEEEALARVARRNLVPGRVLYVSPETFANLKRLFEPLDPDEAFVIPS
ncbi:MAG: ATP-binding protein [Caulobacteraceae bacterium]